MCLLCAFLFLHVVCLWHYFLVKNISTAFSPILVVLHCYKRPDSHLSRVTYSSSYNSVKQPKLVYISVKQPKLMKIQQKYF